MNRSFLKRILISGAAIVMLIITSGCMGPEEIPRPDNLINEDIYIDLLVDVQHIVSYRNAYPDSVNADSLASEVYSKYDVTEEQFLNSHSYYQKDVNNQIVRINKALQKINMEQQILQNKIDSVRIENQKQDSVALVDTTGGLPTPTLRPRPDNRN